MSGQLKLVQAFDSSVPHNLLESKMSDLGQNSFKERWGVRYTYFKLTRRRGYFSHDKNGDGDNIYRQIFHDLTLPRQCKIGV